MIDMMVIGETYPHARHEQWNAPSREVAERWSDEVQARGGVARVSFRYNAIRSQWIVDVWEPVERTND